jgi:arginase
MLGGMPVATAAGKCLHGLRVASGLGIPLQAPDIVMAGLRDLDPPEQAAIEADGLAQVTVDDMVACSDRMRSAMEYLSLREDVIYVHIDLDILDPAVAPAAGLPSVGGIDGRQLGEALANLVRYPKVGALAFVSYDPGRDKDGGTGREVMAGILGATAALPIGAGGAGERLA